MERQSVSESSPGGGAWEAVARLRREPVMCVLPREAANLVGIRANGRVGNGHGHGHVGGTGAKPQMAVWNMTVRMNAGARNWRFVASTSQSESQNATKKLTGVPWGQIRTKASRLETTKASYARRRRNREGWIGEVRRKLRKFRALILEKVSDVRENDR
jgi:hypothetical protein